LPFLAIGFYSFWKYREYTERAKAFGIIAGLLAIPIVKSAPIALPDAAFFGSSLLALLCIAASDRSDGANRLGLLLCAVLSTVASIDLRYAGISLIPPLLWGFFHRSVGSARIDRKRFTLIAVSAMFVLFAGALAATLLGSRVFSLYVSQAQKYYGDGALAGRVLNRVIVVVRSAGEIAVNIPYSRFHSLANVFLVAGMFAVAIAVLLIRRPIHLHTQRVYLISYLLLLVAWPNPAPRLWMPIIPLLVAEAAQSLAPLLGRPRVRLAVQAYAVWFAVTGIAALAYTTRISFAGDRFTQLYGKAGGMADPDIKEGDPSWSHVQYYQQSAPRLLARYGDKRARGD
jgi:hypothetical protein